VANGVYLTALRAVSESAGLKRIAVEGVMDEVNREKTNRSGISGSGAEKSAAYVASTSRPPPSPPFSIPRIPSTYAWAVCAMLKPGIEREVPYPSC